jgi:lipopolysaccharide/colanic/teichoic acid biosynthesis glycosyltransferase
MGAERFDAASAMNTGPFAVSPWCNSPWKRAFDLAAAAVLLTLLLPVLALVAFVVKCTSRGPVFFRQRRPGEGRHEFFVLKFRTMVESRGESPGPVLTRRGDERITKVGRFIRNWKLDELPQLVNVLRGEMSFVGPRPQPVKLWEASSLQADAAVVLSVRPGITSPATLYFRNEEELLAGLSPDEIEERYLETIMPVKLRMEIDYLHSATFGRDVRLILRTIVRIFRGSDAPDELHVVRSGYTGGEPR